MAVVEILSVRLLKQVAQVAKSMDASLLLQVNKDGVHIVQKTRDESFKIYVDLVGDDAEIKELCGSVQVGIQTAALYQAAKSIRKHDRVVLKIEHRQSLALEIIAADGSVRAFSFQHIDMNRRAKPDFDGSFAELQGPLFMRACRDLLATKVANCIIRTDENGVNLKAGNVKSTCLFGETADLKEISFYAMPGVLYNFSRFSNVCKLLEYGLKDGLAVFKFYCGDSTAEMYVTI